MGKIPSRKVNFLEIFFEVFASESSYSFYTGCQKLSNRSPVRREIWPPASNFLLDRWGEGV